MPRRVVPRRLDPDEEATLVEHLAELRHRIFVCLIAILPAFLLAYAFHGRIIERLKDLLPDGTKLVTLGVTEPFTTSIKVSFAVAFAIVLPILVWQAWAFFAPAMAAETQRSMGVFVLFASGLFVSGMAFCYFVVLPRALGFLVGYDGQFYEEQVRASYYFSFVVMTMLASGLAFLMPIFILGLVRLGVLSSAKLRRNRRIGIAAMVAFAVLLPTVDPVSLAFEVLPLLALFELSIWLSAAMERRWQSDDLGEYAEST
jgi:sec-independent protein translocase protein TatC